MRTEKVCFGQYVVYIDYKRMGECPHISVYRMEESGGMRWVNSLQIASDGRIIGWSPAGESVPYEVSKFCIDKVLECKAYKEGGKEK